jgi:hypothetical protein
MQVFDTMNISASGLSVSTSDHIERGGCLIEGHEENVDARIREQLQTLNDALRAAVEIAPESTQEAPPAGGNSDVVVDDVTAVDDDAVDAQQDPIEGQEE